VLKAGWVAAWTLALACGAAHAEVKASAPDGFILHHEADVAIASEALWERLIHPEIWWASSHTYSGASANLSLAPVAGGCWCETWDGGAVEHGRVVSIMPGTLLRLDSTLGPLQDIGATGALTFTFAKGSAEGRTRVSVDYKVSGSALSKLDELAPIVDGVWAEQFSRLVHPSR